MQKVIPMGTDSGAGFCSGHRSARRAQMSQIGCSPLSRNKGTAGGSYFILMALNSLVATLVVLPFGGDLPLYGFRHSTNILQHHRE